MHGKNPVRKQELTEDGRLWVQEIFSTIQGEGAYAGTPSVFIRLAGCNLTCKFCDTEFESAFKSPVNFMTVSHISTIVNRIIVQYPGCNNIVLTGGEPFRQNFIPLVAHLNSLGYTIEIETAGTLWLKGFSNVSRDCYVTVSPKTQKINRDIEHIAGAYKYVVGESNKPVGHTLIPLTEKGQPLAYPVAGQPIFIQPMDTHDIFEQAKNIDVACDLAKQTGWRLSVQIHKYIGVE